MSRARPGRFYGVARDRSDLDQAFDLRREVFCVEQGISEADEFDGLDAAAAHIVGCEEDDVVATCRLVIDPPHCRLGRMAVARPARGCGAGRRLIAAAEQEARGAGARVIIVHAQRAVERFYAGCWFVAEGQTFTEDGIDHVRMRKTIVRE